MTSGEKPRLVLGIESSCDESAVAVMDSERGLLGHRVFSQIELHRAHGGVVPELASRDHIRRLLPMIEQLLADLGLARGELDAVAYTAGPGLVGALLTGAALGEALAFALGIPALRIHHLEGHLLASELTREPPPYPHVALLVSGGHTLLIEVAARGHYQLLGASRDDAAGEAFDKCAKLLGLSYPGGPQLAALAERGRAGACVLPRPMLHQDNLEFSFAGLKTAVRQAILNEPELGDERRADIARAVQDAIVEVLVGKSKRALELTGLSCLVVSGGVSANAELRSVLATELAAMGASCYFPSLEFCTDNAAMIALTGLLRLTSGEGLCSDLAIVARPRWPLEELNTR
ncbi:MAG: tRNA (adenosine(37)-N6)-threonylcarbamoyltransferase complex transferase subunit TsaD [Steroidobacteraceae bacterium]